MSPAEHSSGGASGTAGPEYLVTMTTQVPDGTPGQKVDDVRAREAARSRQLAAGGYLVRLWRSPQRPGQWRSIGLFAAPDRAQLAEVLASMPLHVWRTDEITPLYPHPNDPALAPIPPAAPAPSGPAATGAAATGAAATGAAVTGAAEFLTTFNVAIPEAAAAQAVEDTEKHEAERAHELAGQGHLLRLWTLPAGSRAAGVSRALGLWRAHDAGEMQAILKSLPLDSWMTVETTQLGNHPSDPAVTQG